MSRKLVVVLPRLTAVHQTAIEEAARGYGIRTVFCPDAAAAQAELADAEIVLGAGTELTQNAPRLRWYCTPQAGVNPYLAPDAFASPDCLLTNSSGAYGTTIAEHIVMVTLMLMRRIPEYTGIVSSRDWTRNLRQHSIAGSRVTLLGTGDIGQETAKRLRAFSPKAIIGVNRTGQNPGEPFDRVELLSGLDVLLPETDLLILSLPGTPETNGLLTEARLQSLPRDAFLVNVGRGNAIDQAALERLLRAGHLSGAALDVFETEPLPRESSLWDCPRLLITPHVAGNMTLDYTVDRIVALFIDDLHRYCTGQPLKRLVDRQLGY